MSILPLLLRILLAVVLVTPGAGSCALADTVADTTTAAAMADLPPCHAAAAADAPDAPAAPDPAADDHGGDGCSDGVCDCGCPCRALTALGAGATEASATLPESPSSAARPAPRSDTPPPPPTPPPIA